MRPIEFQILLALAAGERHGYALLHEIESRFGSALETGMLYRGLQRLLEQGFVREAKGPAGEDERRRYYAIAAAGRRAVADEACRLAALVDAARATRLIPGDPQMLPVGVQSRTEVIRQVGLIATSVTRLFTACFGFALLLAVAGAYGLMSRSIGLRTREIGVRRALGASDGSVARLLVGQGGRQLGIGPLFAAPVLTIVGLAFRYYFPVEGWVTVVIGVTVSLAIVGVVLLATWFPTRRVLRTSPRDALWTEEALARAMRHSRRAGARSVDRPAGVSPVRCARSQVGEAKKGRRVAFSALHGETGDLDGTMA